MMKLALTWAFSNLKFDDVKYVIMYLHVNVTSSLEHTVLNLLYLAARDVIKPGSVEALFEAEKPR